MPARQPGSMRRLAGTRKLGSKLGAAFVCVATCCACLAGTEEPRSPEARAVAFLSVEVPQWQRANACFSCHNNGDAARALVQARTSALLADEAPLATTLEFLHAPQRWDANGPDGPFKDTRLARLQFASALAEAARARLIESPEATARSAALVAELQAADGFWETDAPGTLGSPVTYGRALATALSVRVLEQAGTRYRPAIERAWRWFEAAEPKNVLDAAATMLGLRGNTSDAAGARRQQCWQLIQQGQASDGGWGPFATAPPQVFDTAVVVLALSEQAGQPYAAALARGRAYLIAQQEGDGGWPATTRPPGVDSYAQRISTSGWALQALLAAPPVSTK